MIFSRLCREGYAARNRLPHQCTPEPRPIWRPRLKRLEVDALYCHGIGPVKFSVGGEEIVVLSGPSGAGKTLLLRAIADVEPHQGDVYLDGCSYLDIEPPQWRRKVAMLPAESQWWRARVVDHFRSIDDSALDSLELPADIVQRPVNLLSSGESQRLVLLRLLQNQPRVVLLDEPTASLDQSATRAVEHLIKQYAVKTGACVLWVSHSPDQAQRLAGRRFDLSRGQLTEISGHADHLA